MKRFHISCCGRSGSRYIWLALNSMGINCIHEMPETWPITKEESRLGKKSKWPEIKFSGKNEFGLDHIRFFPKNKKLFINWKGIVGWKWALLTPRFAKSFECQFHLVRNPIKAIESATTHSTSVFDFVEKKLGDPDFIHDDFSEDIKLVGRSLNYWIKYNKQISKGKVIIKLEDFHRNGSSAKLFLNKIYATKDTLPLLDFLPNNYNSRPNSSKRVKVDLDLLDAYYPKQSEQVKKLSRIYGY